MEYVENMEAQKKAENTIYLTDLNPSDIESFTCWYAGEERRFEKRNGQWVAINSINTKLQQDWMERMVSNLAQMTAESKIENVKDLNQFGFADSFKQYGVEMSRNVFSSAFLIFVPLDIDGAFIKITYTFYVVVMSVSKDYVGYIGRCDTY